MEMWFSDEHTDNVKLSIRVDKQLFSAQSEFQRIDVLESKEFGKILVTDGDLMLTEKDEFIYHEMMAHVPMAVHPKVENVLVIGGGDGGCVRELAKYNTIQKIDVVEVDPLLVEVCRKYFPPMLDRLDKAFFVLSCCLSAFLKIVFCCSTLPLPVLPHLYISIIPVLHLPPFPAEISIHICSNFHLILFHTFYSVHIPFHKIPISNYWLNCQDKDCHLYSETLPLSILLSRESLYPLVLWKAIPLLSV